MDSDGEIARAARLMPITAIGEKLGIPADALIPYGHTKAKLAREFGEDEVMVRRERALSSAAATSPPRPAPPASTPTRAPSPAGSTSTAPTPPTPIPFTT